MQVDSDLKSKCRDRKRKQLKGDSVKTASVKLIDLFQMAVECQSVS